METRLEIFRVEATPTGGKATRARYAKRVVFSCLASIQRTGVMVNHCVVVGCMNYVGKKPGLCFYQFLADREFERRRK